MSSLEGLSSGTSSKKKTNKMSTQVWIYKILIKLAELYWIKHFSNFAQIGRKKTTESWKFIVCDKVPQV